MIDKRSLAEQIRDRLIEQIASGALRPGDRLVELRIAKEAGTSQAPVREALRALDALGLITFRKNRGAVVRKIDAAEQVEIYAVRAELEGYAARLVAETAPESAVPLLALCDQMDDAVAAGDRDGFVTLNAQFHHQIVEASGNATLLALWQTLDVRLRTLLNTARGAEHLPRAARDHRAIAEAIAMRAGDRARALMVAHINAVAHRPVNR